MWRQPYHDHQRNWASAGRHYTVKWNNTEYKPTRMSKKWTIIWLSLIFTLFLVLAIYTFHKNNPVLLVTSEIVIPILYAITLMILLRIIQTDSSIGRSLSLLKEGDFNITMVKTGNTDVDNIIEVYNSMITGYAKRGYRYGKKIIFSIFSLNRLLLGIIILDLDERIIDINKAHQDVLD